VLINALTLSEDILIESDICIVGAGAAGITLAREFIDQPYEVCILESGGLDFEDPTQSLYQGENTGLPYFPLKESRARYLGGSTNLWGGWCRPMDDIDFQDRPWMRYSGWPITKAELDPYYERAQEVCGLGPYLYNFSDWQDSIENLQYEQLKLGKDVETYLWQLLPPERLCFGQVYRTTLEQAKNIKTYLYANVVNIETNDTAKEVTRLRVACLDGKQFWVQAKVFILAVGGMENPRLLLASNEVASNGLGNQYDVVGRYFMEHPYLKSGKIKFTKPPHLYRQHNKIQVDQNYLAVALGLSPQRQESEQILNFAARIVGILPDCVTAINGIKYKLQRNHPIIHEAFPSSNEISRFRTNTTLIEDLKTILTNLDQVAVRAYQKLFDKSFYSEQTDLYENQLIGEQEPNPDSRITLSSERDRLGLNCIKLDWRLTSLDKYTMIRSQQILAEELARYGLGKMQLDLSEDEALWQDLRGSYHHMGTTRMSTNPKQGVVDENCQVYGMGNLYVAGSSVFPTSGLSNPTLTIIALALRLADHLKAGQVNPVTTFSQMQMEKSASATVAV
jgi:choline dehydrogenase-like flavoprotein